MAASVTFREVQDGDVEALIADLRAADKAEILAYSDDIEVTINHALQSSEWAHAAVINGELACIFGIGPVSMTSDTGVPWLLGTNVMNRNKRSVIAYGARYTQAMLKQYSHLWNMVHAENVRSIRWLKHLGFTVHEAQAVGPKQSLFHAFEMRS